MLKSEEFNDQEEMIEDDFMSCDVGHSEHISTASEGGRQLKFEIVDEELR